MALTSGLDTVINPGADGIVDTMRAFNVLSGQDEGAIDYIDYNNKKAVVIRWSPSRKTWYVPTGKCCWRAMKLIMKATNALLKENTPLAVVDDHIVPALDEVGNLYEQKNIFLPQLIRAAETAGKAFETIRAKLAGGTRSWNRRNHRDGYRKRGYPRYRKESAKVLLENYGYDAIDLGSKTGSKMAVAKKTSNW